MSQDVETLTNENNDLRELNDQYKMRITELEEQVKPADNTDKNLVKPPSKAINRKKMKDEEI